jgi:hypothetical protein
MFIAIKGTYPGATAVAFPYAERSWIDKNRAGVAEDLDIGVQ